MMDFSIQLENFMRSRHFFYIGKINYDLSGKFQRFRAPNSKGKPLFVIIHDYDKGATFGDWHYPEEWITYWNKAYGKPTSYQLDRFREQVEEEKRTHLREQVKKEKRAQQFFHKNYLVKPTSHPYVLRKFITPYEALQCRSYLLIPIRDIEYELITLQIIKKDGFKRLWKGTTCKYFMVWLCEQLPFNYSGIIRICEGYATGCTIRELTNNPVVCALSAFNLPHVTALLRHYYPFAQLKICADNDAHTKDNPGFHYAVKAAIEADQLHEIPIYAPDFSELDDDNKLTDFNDLYCLAGRKETILQLKKVRDYRKLLK